MAVLTFDLDTLRRDLDVTPVIARLIPEENPWVVMLLQSRKKGLKTAEFYWFEEDPYGYWSTVPSETSAGATSIVVATGDGVLFKAKDIAKIPATNEIVFVSSVSTDTLTVIRGLNN
jgi:hypothetical protein